MGMSAMRPVGAGEGNRTPVFSLGSCRRGAFQFLVYAVFSLRRQGSRRFVDCPLVTPIRPCFSLF